MAKLKTGRHTSAIKEFRQSEKSFERNKAVRSKIHTLKKKIETAVASKDKDAAAGFLKSLFSELDKAARKNVIHTNAAANQKARLSKRVLAISK